MLSLTVETKSWMHRWPVETKLLLVCLFSLLMVPVNDWRLALFGLIAVALLYASAGWAFAKIGLVRLRPLSYLVALLFLYFVLTARLEEGLLVSFKLFATIGFANLVTMTSRLDDLMAVVEWLAKPLRFFGLPPRALSFAMGLVVRFTPLFLQKSELLHQAWRARSPKKSSARLLVPLALNVLDDADHVAEALRARGGIGSHKGAQPTNKNKS
ncbi:energy-coupling factor transporter transmembrane protein EcfT [uncultured Cohaesibacter sp.]|uniref:energy-coupling factor transporter transmembrane component T family protein n=1 Tax=uncultured Cohaesibacter sp. TaxID=1002546 RepID=UPI00292F361D|nr:energy-coupling factor transporter transmembrane protein EcfT [uncultured Cohaesibacter sp.]